MPESCHEQMLQDIVLEFTWKAISILHFKAPIGEGLHLTQEGIAMSEGAELWDPLAYIQPHKNCLTTRMIGVGHLFSQMSSFLRHQIDRIVVTNNALFIIYPPIFLIILIYIFLLKI